MRIVLVNPPDGQQIGRVDNELAIPPFGIASIAAVLAENGFDVRMYDLALEWPLDLDRLARLGFFDADIYGFGSYTSTFPTAVRTAEVVRERQPKALMVFGGPHAGPSPERILRRHPQIDVVISRDGEMPFLEMARRLASGRTDLAGIPQLSYRGADPPGDQGGVPQIRVSTALVPRVSRDDMPWPSRDFVIEPPRYVEEAKGRDRPVRVEFMLGSTGCPKRCTFCSIIVMQPQYRSRSPKSMVAEAMSLYAGKPYGHLRFVNANFLAQTPRALDFARQLHAWNPDVRWSGTATADTVVRKKADVLQMGGLNCHSLEIGIESGSDPVLERFGKGPNVPTNEAAIAVLAQAGIELELDFIMFDPPTTLDDIQRNLQFLRRNALSSTFPAHHVYNRLRLYPGTTDMFSYEELGLVTEDELDTVIVPPLRDPRTRLVYEGMELFRVTVSERLAALAVALDVVFREGGHQVSGHAALRRSAGEVSLELRHGPERMLAALVDVAVEYPEDDLPDTDALVRAAADRCQLSRLQDSAEQVLYQAVEAGLTALAEDESDPAPGAGACCSGGLSVVQVDGQDYVLDLDRGWISVLNETGVWLWDELRAGVQPADLVGKYQRWAELTSEEAEIDVTSVVSQLTAAKLLDGAGVPAKVGPLVETRLSAPTRQAPGA